MNHYLKKGLYILVITLAILTSLAIVAAFYIDPYLENIIKEKVKEQSKGLYEINFEKLNINFINRSIKLENASFDYDSSIYNKRVLNDTIPQLYQLHIKTFQIKGIHLWAFLKNKKIILNQIIIDEPIFVYTQKDTVKKINQNNENTDIFSKFESITIKKINVKNANFVYNDILQKDKITVKSISLNFDHIYVDKNNIDKPDNILYSKEIEWFIKDAKIKDNKGFYTLNINELNGSILKQNIEILGLNYIPNYDKNTFAKLKKKQDDRIEFISKKITLDSIDFKKAYQDKNYIVKKIILDSFALEIYRDARVPRDWSDLKEFPNEPFFAMETPIKVDSIVIKNSYIEVQQMPESGLGVGKVTFNKVQGFLTKVDNQNKHFYLNASCQFMNNATLSLYIDCIQKNGINKYQTHGQLLNFNIQKLNSITRSMANVNIESGNINTLNYQFYSDGKISKGDVQFLFNNLKIKMLANDNHSSNLKQKVISKISNNFIINSENNTSDYSATTGDINYVRDKHFSFYNFYWKSIFSGIKEVVIKENPITSKIKGKLKDKQKESRKRR